MAHQSSLDAIPAPKSQVSYCDPDGPYQPRKDSYKGSGDNKSQNRQSYKQHYSGYSAKGKQQHSKDQSKSGQSQNRSEGSSRQDKDRRTSQQSRNFNKSKKGRWGGSGQRP